MIKHGCRYQYDYKDCTVYYNTVSGVIDAVYFNDIADLDTLLKDINYPDIYITAIKGVPLGYHLYGSVYTHENKKVLE